MALIGVGTTISLLMLISLGIASLIREYDLTKITTQEIQITHIPHIDIEFYHLGPFTVTHALNHFIVILSFNMAAKAYSGGGFWDTFTAQDINLPLFLTLITGLYAAFYPYLEVTEYQVISPTPNSIFPASIQFHYLFSGFTLGLALLDTYFDAVFGVPVTSGLLIQLLHIVISLLLILIIPVTVVVYSAVLHTEILRDVRSTRGVAS
ncbi:hypothetical protein BDK88_4365 [Natrinema hispanicum]|uniref:Uncharacterized protein n=1 Tax=Natrinema hispanicum TaxID=392421 RepID=A0A482Y4I3_9EURY|nr:hypothetical protein [Natrinema hispanicum]RZV05122.1 hypothetical protein BDK88_4365 [Natrinema hispanicum]